MNSVGQYEAIQHGAIIETQPTPQRAGLTIRSTGTMVRCVKKINR